MTEEMVRWHHRLDGHEFEQALGVGDGQGSLTCCSPWGYKESDMIEQQQQCPLHLISPSVMAAVTYTTMKGWVQYSRSTVQMPSTLELLSGASF